MSFVMGIASSVPHDLTYCNNLTYL